MTVKKVLLFVGLAGAGYAAYRTVRLANTPKSDGQPLGLSEALRSQGGQFLLPAAALIAYKVF
ncbi:MAG TPA: hypothetical protein VFJ64_10700 [Solirubrobacterales bacterium]|nr:hypothetical protein [Solirubrobacterales bacterium]